ncbi:hypothetical protein LC085_17115 [Bacillus tianshenii]|uniref:hypothetical protein n=1 Tax=Sutcliffiella tianshenii TaxID=1463404 RepID=UPI001CD2CE74|nr:hypothetical protein [Bacillus tianshenii]MCA1321629.1 hypothetical protein [Bacillus tianshenii]
MKKEDEHAMPIQIPTIETEKELSFEEQLKLLSKSFGNISIEDSDQICREVRGKES